jgi:hypothetical protein
MDRGEWFATVDVRFPFGVCEVPDGRLDFLLTLLADFDGTLTVPIQGEGTLAVTVTVTAGTKDTAAERAELVVHENLCSLGLGDDDWCVVAIEVCTEQCSAVLHDPIVIRGPLAQTA